MQKLTALLIARRVFRSKIILLRFKNSQAYYNAGLVAVNSKIVGLAPGHPDCLTVSDLRVHRQQNRKLPFRKCGQMWVYADVQSSVLQSRHEQLLIAGGAVKLNLTTGDVY
jgi:hypothetical protein